MSGLNGSDLPATIALWSGAIMLAGFAIFILGGEVVRLWRGGESLPAPGVLGHLIGGLGFAAVIAAFPALAAIFAAGLLIAAGATPVVFLFVSLAGMVGFAAALRSSGYGMDGCSKMIGVVCSSYVMVWGLAAFWGTGGLERAAAGGVSLQWLTPFLAALPLAVLFTRLKGDRRTVWTFPAALALFAAWLALLYFPVEAGLGARWLPASDWLRFPLAGLAAGLMLAGIQLLGLIGGNATVRARRLRELPRGFLIGALLVAPTGLAWAAARAIIAAVTEGA